ncbi:MAG TPA: T9SS type A sorting domain-containing protein, partial [Bacteroidia bacterium]|nr:T9SS type A sorting domain-containing protein [Bacteroidia bacterium]
NSPFNTDPNPVYSYSGPGTMTVTLVSSDGLCFDTTTQTVFVIDNTSVNESALNGNISVFSGEGSIGIQFNLESVEHAQIKVYDASGKLYYDNDSFVGKNKIDIPMKDAAAEMYLVIIELPEKIYSSKVIVRK